MSKVKKVSKKYLSVLLVLVMLMSAVPIGMVSVDAAEITIYQQTDPKWKNYSYGSGGTSPNTIGNKGCGILATVNAVNYLTGNFINPKKFADWAMKAGEYCNGVGSYFSIAKDSVKEFGSDYEYKLSEYYDIASNVKTTSVTCSCGSKNSGFPKNKSDMEKVWNKLVSHLKDGETCVTLVPHHFIAIVDYDSQKDKVLVFDSAVKTGRGTSTSVYSSSNWKSMNELWCGSSEGKKDLKIRSMMTFFKSAKSPLVKYTITANAVTQSKTTNNSTEFNVGISPKANVEKIGVFYSTKANKSSLININSETEHKSTNKYNYYLLCEKPSDKKINTYQFDTAKKTTQNGWTIKFNPNQEYAYRFVVKIGNKWFISNTNYFSTKNDIPAAVTNVGVSGDKQIGIAKTTTITWKKSDKATEYFVNVTNGEGKSVLSKTLKGVNSTTYQTEPLGSPDTYTVHITAKNSSGSSSESITTFEVMPNIKATFDSGIGTPQTLTITYNDCVTTPNAPNREGYQFDGWRYSENNTIVKSGVKINNIKSDVTYTAVWTPKKYTVNIVDGISQKTILSTSQSFGTDFNVAKYISDNNISIPEHNYYEYVGLSENVYNVKAETHTIYVRYKWNSVNSVEAKIEEGGIKRTKSVNSKDNKKNDGYSIDVKVSTPSIESGGTDKTVKGRVVVALKTDAGRLLIETESAAFVLYPQQKDEVSKIINVFVPYEATNESQLPTAIEAYVVNNYYSAGIISNIAKNNAELMAANSLEDNWKYSSTPIQVGDVLSNGEKVVAVDSNEDYYTYDLVTTTTKESLDSSMNGYTLLSTKWSNTLWQGTVSYVKNWPSLVSNGGDQFDNTKGAGQYIYNKYNNTPVTSSESDDMKIEVIEQPCDYIYYHWCKNRDNGNLVHHVTAHKTGDYNTFHCHSLSPNKRLDYQYISADNIKSFEYEYDASGKAASYRDRCTDSKYWEKEIPVYLQGWYTHKKIFTYSKTDINKGIVVYNEDDIEKKSSSSTSETKEFPVNDIELNTTVEKHPTNITHWYAYKPENNTIAHEDKNIIQGGVSGFVGKEYAMKNATVYIYKSNQVSDFTTEFIEGTIIDSDGKFKIDTVQTREAISSETGDFTIAVAIEGETNAIVTGTIKAPLPVDSYKVRFVSATDKKDANGNIVYDVISEQNVVPGEAAYLPDESNIPKKEGYHFVCWNQSAEIVNGDMTVQAIYEANEYAIVFVDWESKKSILRNVSMVSHLSLLSYLRLPMIQM